MLANSPSLAPSPVKSKRSTAMPCAGQPLGDALGRQIVLAAGEAVGEQREGRRLAERPIERGGELLACGVGEGEAFAAHGKFLRSAPQPYVYAPAERCARQVRA